MSLAKHLIVMHAWPEDWLDRASGPWIFQSHNIDHHESAYLADMRLYWKEDFDLVVYHTHEGIQCNWPKPD